MKGQPMLSTYDDGCIIPNLATKTFRVVFTPDCGHSKVKAAVIDFEAIDLESASQYVATWLKFPKMHVHRIYSINPESLIARPIPS
jgi:hypothetical protein